MDRPARAELLRQAAEAVEFVSVEAGHQRDGGSVGAAQVLRTVGDEPMYDNAITWRWRATRNSAGLPHVRLHDLRHFYASGLIAAGCDVVTVQLTCVNASDQ